MASTSQPVTEDAFTEDRRHFLHSFVNFVTVAAIAVVILLILMAYFLT